MGIGQEERIAELEALVERQRQEIERLKEMLEEQTGRVGRKRPEIKPSVKNVRVFGPKPARRMRLAGFNHGRERMTPTATKAHQLEACPECGEKLVGGHVARRREVIDVPERVAIQVTEHQVISRYCMGCNTWHMPRLDLSGEVSGKQRFGHNLVGWVCYLRHRLNLPINKIQEALKELCSLKISAGELVALIKGVADKGAGEITKLTTLISNQPVVHCDETGWRENGANGYTWVVTTTTGYSVFIRSASRAASVIEGILPDYAGTVVSDFYGAYNFIGANRQRCWAHLKRDLDALREEHTAKHPRLVLWLDGIEQLYKDACEFVKTNPDAPIYRRKVMFNSLTAAVHQIAGLWLHERGHPAHAMCKRLRRHEDELFHFVRQQNVAATNNLAERVIRPLVTARKISGGSRSPAGTQTRMVMHSLFTTWTAIGYSTLDACLALICGHPPPLQL